MWYEKHHTKMVAGHGRITISSQQKVICLMLLKQKMESSNANFQSTHNPKMSQRGLCGLLWDTGSLEEVSERCQSTMTNEQYPDRYHDELRDDPEYDNLTPTQEAEDFI